MNYLITNFKSKLCLFILSVLFGFSPAIAKDLGPLMINTIYECPAFENTTASFTPETTGEYRINYSVNDPFAVYSNGAMTVDVGCSDWAYMSETIEGLATTYYETFQFQGGVTYYLGGSPGEGKFSLNNVKFVITEASSQVELKQTIPAEKSIISVGLIEKIDFIFSASANVESVSIKTGSESVNLPFNHNDERYVIVYSNTVSVVVKDFLLNWLNSGVIKEGDVFTITLHGVNAATEDGSVSASFISAGMPGQLVSTINTPDQMPHLKSYYMKNDDSGVISLEFDKDLLVSETDGAFALFGIGNKESETGDYYEEVIPAIIDENILKIDLRGKLRNLEAMGLSSNYVSAQLDIKNVKTADGIYVYSEGSGKVGSFNYIYDFVILDCSIMSEFTPSSGDIKAGDKMEIWISGYNDITYTGVNFAYTVGEETKNVVVEHDKIVVESDPLDATASTLKFDVPLLVADENTEVTVSLAGFEAIDGLDHSSDILAKYTYVNPSSEIIVVATPEDGEVVEQLVTIYLEWIGASVVTVDPALMVGGAKLYKKGESELFSDMICSPTGSGNTAVLDIFNIPSEDGEYEVKIDAGMFEVDGQKWHAFTLNYTIGGGVEVTLNDKGESALANLELLANPCEKIEINSANTNKIILAYLVEGISEVGTYDVEITGDNTANLTLNSTAELKEGDYVIWIPESYFMFDGKPNEDIKFYFEDIVFTDLKSLEINLDNMTIYNLNGLLIKRNANVLDLNNLDAGVYIVNGRKLMITK